MEIWLKQNKINFRLPILPADFEETQEQDNKQEMINGAGEINLLGLDKLETMTISAHFPANDNYYNQYSNVPDPASCKETIETIKKNGPFQFIITGFCNYEATIEDFSPGIQDATGDIYYSMTIRRYRRPTAKRSGKTAKTVTVKVKKGDTWAKLAKKYTGSSKNASKIKKYNKMTNKKKPPVGKKVVIPV